ncbi:MAG: SAM-dependent methyltransferase [Prolixibacteraceae bacterium]|nr:SAM-dependent methyltransferase [Prolixibacteraceae bacterium]
MLYKPEYDPLGFAIFNYYRNKDNTPVLVTSKIVEDEALPPDYFFREYADMPLLERIALKKCRGKILDIGAGAGCHSLFLQNKGYDITSLELSMMCCEVISGRGINKVVNRDIFDFDGDRFDTLLLLMNGVGIAGTLDGLKELLKQLKKLLNPGASILLDSSDLIYLHMNKSGELEFDINSSNYYGEIEYQLKYKEIIGEPFSWLFIDNVLLSEIAEECGFVTKVIEYGPHYDYLAELTMT